MGGIVALGNCFMPVRVERLANALLGLDTMLLEQQAKLPKRHFHTFMKLRGAWPCTGGQSAFEVVDCRQQLMDKRLLLRGRAGVAFLAAAPLEILEIRGQAQPQICLFGEFVTERVRICGNGLGGDGACFRSGRWRVLDFRVHGLNTFLKEWPLSCYAKHPSRHPTL